jgi:streptomycin 6-kinase
MSKKKEKYPPKVPLKRWFTSWFSASARSRVSRVMSVPAKLPRKLLGKCHVPHVACVHASHAQVIHIRHKLGGAACASTALTHASACLPKALFYVCWKERTTMKLAFPNG